jgi:hypothetical protein
MAKSKQHRRKLYKVENTPVKETPRYDGDGTEWIFESPDGGNTIYKRAIGTDEKILVKGRDDDEWHINQYNRNRPSEEHIKTIEEFNERTKS